MREWIDELSTWLEEQENAETSSVDISEQAQQTAVEMDELLQISGQIESAYSQFLEKVDHVNS